MRGKLSRMWRSSLSLMLVFCMLVSMAPAAFATDSSEPTTIKYVSLGDSVSLGSGSYPNLFASWLEAEGYADDVDHTALAMDAMRAEDLHFILAYGGANSAVGDDYTRKNFTSVEGFDINETAQQYQAAVKEADLLTVGIGNANFGDFLMDCAMDAVNGNEAKYDVATAMNGLNASLKTELMTVYNKLLAKLEAEVGNEMAVSLANAMVYTMVGYVVNYEAVLDDIVGLNPDAEVIIVPVINTMDGVKLTYNGNTYDIGSYIDDGLKVLNAYLALVATKYENTIFYAEVGEVALQGNAVTLSRADIMETVVGTEGNPGIIWELLADKVDDFYAGAKLVYITEKQVEDYAGKDATFKANYVIDAETNEVDDEKVDLAISLSLYLAFEEAIKASQGKALSIEGLKDLSNPEELINDVVVDVTDELDEADDDYENEAYAAIANLVNEKLEDEIYNRKQIDYKATLNGTDIQTLMTDSEACNTLIRELAFDIAKAGINEYLKDEYGAERELSVDEVKSLYNEPADEVLLKELAEDTAYSAAAKKAEISVDRFKEILAATKTSNEATYAEISKLIKEKAEGAAPDSEYAKYVDFVNDLTAERIADIHTDGVSGITANAIELAEGKISDEDKKDYDSDDIQTLLAADTEEKLINFAAEKAVEKAATDEDTSNDDLTTTKFCEVLGLDNDEAIYVYMVNNASEYIGDEYVAIIAPTGLTVDIVRDLNGQDEKITDAYNDIKKAHTDATDAKNKVSDIRGELVSNIAKAEEALNKLIELCDKIFDFDNTLNTELEENKDKIVSKIREKVNVDAIPALNEALPTIRSTVNDNIGNLCKMLAVSEVVVAVVKDNAALSGLLNIMGRCVIGDGLGMLPTANGHNTIAVAVETSYKTRHTVQDETKKNVELALDKVIEVLEENGMMIVDKATIKNALEYITDLDAAVAVLKGALQDQIDDYKNGVVPALQGDLAAMQKLLSELEDKLEALEKKLEKLENKLNEIQNAPDAAASTIEALEKAIAETNAAIASTRNKIAYVNTCIGALNEKLTQMSATLDKLQAAIVQMDAAVKGLYNAVSTKDISFHDAFNNLEALHASAIEAIYAVEDLYHELKDLGKDTIKFIDTVKDEAKTAVTVLGGSLYVAYKLLPDSVEAKIEAEAEAKIADLKAQIAEKKAQLEQEVKEDVKAELQKQIDALEAEIEAVKAKCADDVEKLGGVNADAVKLIEDVLKDTYDAIHAEYENVTGALKIDIDTKNEVIEASAQAIKNLIKFAEEEIEKVVEEAKAIYADVSNADYTITNSSYYVALGDASAYSASDSYVDILAADPQLALEEAYKNAYDTRTIDEMLADIRGGDVAPEVKTADLITIRFDNSQIVKNAFIHAFTYMKGADVVYTFAWEELIGAKGVQAVNNFLTALEDKLEEYGMEDMKLVEMADGSTLPAEGRTLDKAFVHMAESYLYYSIQYMLSIPEYVAEIHAINPDAVIVFVGMSNPFGNTVLTHENLNIEVGNYVGTIVKYVDMIGKGFCMLFPNATYVSAQDVETNASNVEMDLTQFFMNYVQDQNSTLYPTATGHQYIKDQILKALTITDERSTEPKGLWGDANSDKTVNIVDAMLVAHYSNMAIGENDLDLTVCDVNADGSVNIIDAMLIAHYANLAIDKFPVEEMDI